MAKLSEDRFIEWERLKDELELFIPAKFTDRQKEAIQIGFEPRQDNPLYREMPFSVVEFKKTAWKKIYSGAAARNDNQCPYLYPSPDGTSENLEDIVRRDFTKINQWFSGRPAHGVEAQVYTFGVSGERVLNLHVDQVAGQFFYFARVGGLRTNIIRHARMETITSEEQRLISRARVDFAVPEIRRC